MRMFYVSIQCFILGSIRLQENHKSKVCFRCKVEDQSITSICFHCKKAIYCNRKCLKKNKSIHYKICKFHSKNIQAIRTVMEGIRENYSYYKESIEKANERRKREMTSVS